MKLNKPTNHCLAALSCRKSSANARKSRSSATKRSSENQPMRGRSFSLTGARRKQDVVASDASWNLSRSPLATAAVPLRFCSRFSTRNRTILSATIILAFRSTSAAWCSLPLPTCWTLSQTTARSLEIIGFAGYIATEKLQIATRYLVRRQMERTGSKRSGRDRRARASRDYRALYPRGRCARS